VVDLLASRRHVAAEAMQDPSEKTSTEERDAATAAMLARGEPEGLRRLLIDHGGAVLAVLAREFAGVLDRQALEDALAEAVVRTWRAGGRYDPRAVMPSAWLYVVARNRALSHAEERRNAGLVYRGDLDDQPAPAAAAATEEVADGDDQRAGRFAVAMAQCLELLSDLQRAVLRADLAHGGSAPARVLAQALNTTRSAIYVARHFGRRAMREALRRCGYTMRGRERPALTPRHQA
jgi:RNA polymerase sigma factor (sigma-70 family)